MNAIVGIDPGMHGGIAVLTDEESTAIVMPTKKINKRTVLDMDAIKEYLSLWDHATDDAFFVYIEDVHSMPGQGVSSTFNFGFGAGAMHGIAYGMGLPVRKISPVTWKRKVLHDDYTHDKVGSIAFCKDWYPSVNLMPGRMRTPHDGIADAICIAHYGYGREIQRVW